jgi:hypothetical protein
VALLFEALRKGLSRETVAGSRESVAG